MQSEQINELASALVKAQSAMKAAVYNKINPHFKNKYADLASVIEAVRKPMSDHGLSVSQTPELIGPESFVLRTTLLHTSGQWISCEYPLPSAANPQLLGSALTYARRYSLSCITCIAADEDDDANAADNKPKKSVSPHQAPVPIGASATTAAPSLPTQESHDGAAPTFNEYEAKWDAIIAAATDAKQLKKTWDDDEPTRVLMDRKSAWPKGSYPKLVEKVKKAMAFLKQSA